MDDGLRGTGPSCYMHVHMKLAGSAGAGRTLGIPVFTSG